MSRYHVRHRADRAAMLEDRRRNRRRAVRDPGGQAGGEVDLPDGKSEPEVFDHLSKLAARNADADSEICFLGAGMYDHYSPAIVDAILSRSEFLTPYTPYQPEVSQGGLQAMFEFQTAMSELTALPVSNASMYEGPSSVASAAYLALGARKGRHRLVVSRGLHRTAARRSRPTPAASTPRWSRSAFATGSPTRPSSRTTSTRTSPRSSSRIRTSSAGSRTSKRSPRQRESGALAVASVDPMTLGVLRPPARLASTSPWARASRSAGASTTAALVRLLLRDRGALAHAGADRRRDDRRRRRRGFVLALRARDLRREKAAQHLHLAGAERARRRDHLVWLGKRGLVVGELMVRRRPTRASVWRRLTASSCSTRPRSCREFAITVDAPFKECWTPAPPTGSPRKAHSPATIRSTRTGCSCIRKPYP